MNRKGELNLTTYHFQGQLELTNIRGNPLDDEISWDYNRRYTMMYPLSIDDTPPAHMEEETPVLMNVIHRMEQGQFRQQMLEDDIDWKQVRLMAMTIVSPLWRSYQQQDEQEGKKTQEKFNNVLDKVDFFRQVNRFRSLRCLGNRFESKVRRGKSSFQSKGVKFLVEFLPSMEAYADAWGWNRNPEKHYSMDETMEVFPLENQSPKDTFIGIDPGDNRRVWNILYMSHIKEMIYKSPVNWSKPEETPGQLTIVSDQGEIDFCEVYGSVD